MIIFRDNLRLVHTKRQHQRQCFEWVWMVLMLTLGVNGTGINQCNPSTRSDNVADADAWCKKTSRLSVLTTQILFKIYIST